MRFLIAPITAALLLSALLLSACGDEATPPAKTGALTVLATIAPDPPKVGQNTLMITVKSSDGSLLEGATITVDPQMPMHGHGSSETAKIVEKGQGVYEAIPVTLQMPGKWEVTVSATKEKLTGTALLKFDVL